MTTAQPSVASRPATHGLGGYLPIEDHGVIGDLHTVALVGTDGTIDWYCPPRFDSPSVFGAILDRGRGGHYRIAPAQDGLRSKQLYLPDTNVLITRYLGPDGVGEVQDFMPVQQGEQRGGRRIVRRVLAVRGEMHFRLELEPRFDYGRAEHETSLLPGGALFRGPEESLALGTSQALAATRRGVTSEFVLQAGETSTFVLDAAHDLERPRVLSEDRAEELLEDTVNFWLGWIGQSQYSGRWREMVNRSALTLKLLTYEPTGALVAAATASLPEQLGGERNWDYRFTWIRDAAFSLYALLRLGFTEEAEAFNRYSAQIWEQTKADGPGALQLMYRIDGRPDLEEEILDHLEGHAGSRPVRIGNEAADQLQLDIYGALVDSIYIFEQSALRGRGALIPYQGWQAIRAVTDWVCENWEQPDEGIWEVRSGRERFTFSRLMCWVAVDRAIRIAERRAFPADLARWVATRDEIYERIMTRCWSERRQAFVQYEGTEALDASVLLMPLVHFISPTDPRWLSTLDAIGQDLVADSLVYRYDPELSPDGLAGDEGTFSICSFWYVECLARAGRTSEARLAFEKMLTYANHVGLYSEEIGSSGEALGNFPQAFAHLSLISAALNLDRLLDQRGATSD
jgi:GH15 family glucan-1,4-alpha-glucosidase